jgi:hypothetical protein
VDPSFVVDFAHHDPPVHHLSQQSRYDERLHRIVDKANIA